MAKSKNNPDNIIEKESHHMMVKLSESIFHDFKNILATISGLAQLSMLSNNLEEIHGNLKTIAKSAFDCKDFIDVFNGFVKGVEDKDMKPRCFNDILSSTLDMARYKLTSNPNIKIDLEFNLFSKAIINCNEYEVRQSLLNLILNAIESMEEKGGTLKVNTFDSCEMLVIEIIDMGTGMPKEIIDKIFEPYFTTKGEKGTGLGLKIVKDSIDSHGATIEIESEVGVGTKITILVPIAGYCQ